jgi:hypothetical protein
VELVEAFMIKQEPLFYYRNRMVYIMKPEEDFDDINDKIDSDLDIKTKEKEQIIKTLVEEFKENREALKFLIKDLESLKSKIDSIFPENLDKRYMRFFEEKVKAATQLFSAILEIRKEISKGLKTEIEMRNKIDLDDDSVGDLVSSADIRNLATRVEKFTSEIELQKRKVIELHKEGGSE